eukprot:CAMPEP_0194760660 /NCGR_PEP_ID=MMETSP0323_2-20130528/13528_1 /TAXON_ID=2866 ORGANISM="Crypthecodinium cohnii, Strain Seligo" /NCGR_SAMPLE_ID=MMETSP0323_2 /ASSEMBLY_ACC=CAM_ASM_000346 /LENGTH=74 /DNA_ID=CAMNT_0039682045 /DNA_START=337 /DNA_END=558 /DNA_ORIENTATION=-
MGSTDAGVGDSIEVQDRKLGIVAVVAGAEVVRDVDGVVVRVLGASAGECALLHHRRLPILELSLQAGPHTHLQM